MLRFRWNSLRTGEHVMVHDDFDPGLALRDRVVNLVGTRPWDTNDVAIRLDHRGPVGARPRRNAVHLLPLDQSSCSRCAAIAARDAQPVVDKVAA